MIDRLGGMAAIESHTHSLTRRLVQGMSSLRHKSSGRPLCTIFGRHFETMGDDSSEIQGG